ncbi:MAG: fatty acid desaturase [Leptolyngbyaceae cyanobacterium SL_7_1]|nr:fatty acid desaturase [Leptolyngbyaceae cyanobacterium SL_7_1]
MTVVEQTGWITQAEYAKKIRPLLPREAFLPDSSKVLPMLINFAILLLGWGIASYLDQWNWYLLWLYLPFAVVMGNSIVFLSFATHELLHNSVIRNPFLRQCMGLFGFAMLWMPPALWKALHNYEHHNKTNSLHDPDRNYLYNQPDSWAKWLQNFVVPSEKVHLLWFVVSMSHTWGIYVLRNLTSILLFNTGSTHYPPASFKVSSKERWAIALEWLIVASLHFSIVAFLGFHPIKVLLGYFLPIWIGHCGIIFYIFTNHMLCQMTEVNDPLINSVSLRVPQWIDRLHLNFSYHTEHHIFPGMNSDYYPLVQTLLKAHYGDRLNLLGAGEAWQLMLQTPRYYKDATTFTDRLGRKSVVCPLSQVSTH